MINNPSFSQSYEKDRVKEFNILIILLLYYMKTRKHKRKYNDGIKLVTSGGKALATGGTTTGGKVIASGGFGCVFSPALKCQGKKTRGKNRISKLLTKKHAISEYNEIKNFKKKLDKIPNYQNYM